MTLTFNPSWNPHYDFDAPANMAEISAVENYRIDHDGAGYAAGQIVDSPWGTNQVIEAHCKNGQEVCLKEITVKPGYMLSLQRHRGRTELWEVLDGMLTVILNGKRRDILSGQSITLPMGAVHSMINSLDIPVTVRETQTGICREKDHVRLVDFNNRPTYPLTSEIEYMSAKLYARIHAEHVEQYGFDNRPSPLLLA